MEEKKVLQELLAPLDSEHLMGLGHESPKTAEIYTHVSKKAINKIVSPLDKLDLSDE